MSRLLVLPVLLVLVGTSTAYAQTLRDDAVAAMIEKQHRIIALDGDGCPKYPEEDIITVCGTPQEQRDRELFQDGAPEDRIRRGEAISTTRAAKRDNSACGVIGSGLGCIQLPENHVRFGSVPETAIPLEEVMKGLAPQDLVDSAKVDGDQ